MDKIIKRPQDLPDTIDKLQSFILIGKQKLIACKAEIKAIEDVNLGKAVKDQKLNETQDLAVILLLAEVKLGELLKDIPSKYDLGSRGRTKTLPKGITKKQSFYAQQLAANPEAIKETINDAREKEKIPFRSNVLKMIYRDKKTELQSSVDLPQGEYRTIIIDPPWPIEKISRAEVRPYQEVKIHYSSVTIEAIKNLKLPMAKECHIYLWTTNKFLPIAFEIFKFWNIKYIQTLVWHKNVGFTPYNLFMGNAEFILFGRKGGLSLLKVGEKLCFEAKVREHSRKPDEFYDIVRRVSPEPRIDLFSREKREGFDQWGDEVDKFKI